jgi:hypothetical protein
MPHATSTLGHDTARRPAGLLAARSTREMQTTGLGLLGFAQGKLAVVAQVGVYCSTCSVASATASPGRLRVTFCFE